MRTTRSLTVSRSILQERGVCPTNSMHTHLDADPPPTPRMQIPLDTDIPGCRQPLMQNPSPCEQTDRCENITLSQTSFAGGNKVGVFYASLCGASRGIMDPPLETMA